MSVIYNGTTLSLIKYNNSDVYAIRYNGSLYCVSCSYYSMSCGSPCSGSSASSSCNARCSTSSSGGTCGAACAKSLSSSCFCGVGLGLNSVNARAMSMKAKAVRNLLGTYDIAEERSKWLEYMIQEEKEWKATCDTYLDNEDVPQDHKDDFKRIYEEVSEAVAEDKATLETQLKEQYPNMTDYEINFEENKVYVYGDGEYIANNDTADQSV